MPVSEIAKIGKELADSLASARRLFAVEDEPVPVVDGPGATLALGTNGTGQPLIQYDDVSLPMVRRNRLYCGTSASRSVGTDGGAGGTLGIRENHHGPPADALLGSERGQDPSGGHDLRDYGLDELRQRMALVSQDTYLFNTTVRDNLRIGRPEATEELIEPHARPTPMSSLLAYPTATTP